MSQVKTARDGVSFGRRAQQACRPSSVPPEAEVIINLALPLPEGSSGQPEALGRAPLTASYLALHRAGFGRPPIRTGAGGLLPHHFTLILPRKDGMFLCHFPSPAACDAGAWVLPSALPGGARTFLPDWIGAITRPAELSQVYHFSRLRPRGRGPGWRVDPPVCFGLAGWTGRQTNRTGGAAPRDARTTA